MKFIKHMYWFMKESYSFMRGHNRLWITVSGIPRAYKHAKFMRMWDKMTPDQREYWYLTEDRMMEF